MKKTKKRNREIRNMISQIFKEKYEKSSEKIKPITVGWPVYNEKEILKAISSLLKLNLSQGKSVREFEESFAKYVGVKYAVAVNSGSSANLLALNALIENGNIEKGSEVIIPAATFATVASPIIQLGLIPVYVDVDPDTWNIDVDEIKKAIGKKTSVIMPVHTFGNPADMKEIMGIAKENNLYVLEDCCEAHGASIKDKKVGSFGDLSTLSFFVAHNITTGEGGMIFTNNKKLYHSLISLREFGRLVEKPKKRFGYRDKYMNNYDERYIFTSIGYNVRMTDIAASLGIEQLKKLDRLNKKRENIANEIHRFLSQFEDYLKLPTTRKDSFHSFYGYPFVLKKETPFSKNDLASFLEERGIETRAFFAGCLPDQPGFRDRQNRTIGNLPESRYLKEKAIFIGCHPGINKKQIKHIKKTFQDFFKKYIH